ncbi:MAG: hypothetical protein C6W57_07535 [Caldibacillus debilis]|nr:hypothetical protein [Bacillaceae bacterium]OUM83581.1 MAG: hypothetical protein BAA03_08110 [Caldibacillus debilis]REJ16801.1 MAG: hypothetical protein C6W57_07535 [Caldibacillus debilis]REJ31025.1 MAG: hypothetical protein C6W56_01560 [Caldibacillus debilis]
MPVLPAGTGEKRTGPSGKRRAEKTAARISGGRPRLPGGTGSGVKKLCAGERKNLFSGHGRAKKKAKTAPGVSCGNGFFAGTSIHAERYSFAFTITHDQGRVRFPARSDIPVRL